MSIDKKNNTYLIVGLTALLIAIMGLGGTCYLWMHTPKIGFVDNAIIMSQYEGTKEATAKYEQKTQVWQANLDTLKINFENDVADFKKNISEMSKKEQAITNELLLRKQQDVINYKNAIEQKAAEEDVAMTEQVLKQIDTFIKEYAEENAYSYIIGINDNGNLLYGNPKENLTSIILNGLNDKYRGEIK